MQENSVDMVQCPPHVPSCCSAWEVCTSGRRVCCCGHWVCHNHSRRQYTNAANPITIIVCRHCPEWDDGTMFDGLTARMMHPPVMYTDACEGCQRAKHIFACRAPPQYASKYRAISDASYEFLGAGRPTSRCAYSHRCSGCWATNEPLQT